VLSKDKNQMKRTVIDTEDNSKTLLIDNTDVTYHSRHGAITESTHIFIEHGLKYFSSQDSIHAFEMGFGTGLNTILSADFAMQSKKNILLHSIEKYPINAAEAEGISSSYTLNRTDLANYFELVHSCGWSKNVTINPFFILNKIEADILSFEMETEYYDIIFFDAFGPKFQPNLWQPSILTKMFNSLKKGGVLITYCAQGQFKRNLKSVGFTVNNLPGPPGKREITRAIKH